MFKCHVTRKQLQHQGHVNTASAVSSSLQIPSVPSFQTAQGPHGPQPPKRINFKNWIRNLYSKAKRQTQFRSQKECGNKIQEEKCKHFRAIY